MSEVLSGPAPATAPVTTLHTQHSRLMNHSSVFHEPSPRDEQRVPSVHHDSSTRMRSTIRRQPTIRHRRRSFINRTSPPPSDRDMSRGLSPSPLPNRVAVQHAAHSPIRTSNSASDASLASSRRVDVRSIWQQSRAWRQRLGVPPTYPPDRVDILPRVPAPVLPEPSTSLGGLAHAPRSEYGRLTDYRGDVRPHSRHGPVDGSVLADSELVHFPPLRRMGNRSIENAVASASPLHDEWRPASEFNGLGDRQRSRSRSWTPDPWPDLADQRSMNNDVATQSSYTRPVHNERRRQTRSTTLPTQSHLERPVESSEIVHSNSTLEQIMLDLYNDIHYREPGEDCPSIPQLGTLQHRPENENVYVDLVHVAYDFGDFLRGLRAGHYTQEQAKVTLADMARSIYRVRDRIEGVDTGNGNVIASSSVRDAP